MNNLAITMLYRKHSICHFHREVSCGERAVGESRNLHTKQISPLRDASHRFGRNDSKSFLQSTITMASAILLVAILALPLQALEVTMDQALTVANNWIALIIQQRGDWGGSETAEIEGVQEFKRRQHLIGYFCYIKPKGFIIVSLQKELPPIKAYSDTSALDPDIDVGMTDLLKGKIERELDFIRQHSTEMRLADIPDVNSVRKIDYRPAWRALGVNVDGSIGLMDAERSSGVVLMNYTGGEPPLLSSNWTQYNPYNRQCPKPPPGDICTEPNCCVGCGPLACAQVMRYWAWPPWYDWANMPDNLTTSSPQAQIDAVARLCHEVGVLADAIYCNPDWPDLPCASGAPFANADGPDLLDSFVDNFSYNDAADDIDREDYDDPVEWFNLIKTQLNLNRPIPYSVGFLEYGHDVVCDGWQEFSFDDAYFRQYHMNYGGAGAPLSNAGCPSSTGNSNAWYTLDQTPCGNPDDEYMLVDIYPENSLGSWIGAPFVISGRYDVPSFPYRYFDQDAQAPMFAIFAPGHNLQFLAGVKVTTFSLGAFIQFVGEPTANTRLFSIKGTASGGRVAGIRIYNGEIRLYNNGSLKFH